MPARGSQKIFETDPPYFDVPPFLMCDQLFRIEKIAAFGGGAKSQFSKSKKGGGGGSISSGRVRNSIIDRMALLSFSAARLRSAAPCQCRSPATSPPLKYPHPLQAAFAPSVRSCCRSSAGRASRLVPRRA